MKSLVLLALWLCAFVVGAWAQCQCPYLKWATCDGTPCQCSVSVGNGEKQVLNCSTLVPKCFLMKAEMYRARKGLSTRTGGKPTEHAFVDNDGIYDPECEIDGRFKAKQCNNTNECWCVNSAGVRRTDKGDKDGISCSELVETHWIRLELKHKETQAKLDATQLKAALGAAMESRYNLSASYMNNSEYDPQARVVVVDVVKPVGNRNVDLSRMAYYMEKDVKVLPLFEGEKKFQPTVGGQQLDFENIVVYYVDEKPPTFTMKRLTGGIIAVIVVVVLAVVAGLLILFFARRRERARYEKTQPREMDEMQQSLS
ncbi:Tumor-associated calcium signal transducer 2 precursor-like [Scleropages formosus]|uniref:Tumor-associated calcium signal transducer 2-like n=1 Tax=Scleropages formosus TaxID=113540 RepID=A0A0P7UNX7_SCLFO|nr:tumor-associated calcium signal transducer 2-like [Scleropages formosus]KPP70702.1 Tumor-associated calcium signal transducer 2 precursor-like [Scleropages formosus]